VVGPVESWRRSQTSLSTEVYNCHKQSNCSAFGSIMFSAQQLKNFGPKRRVTQETFDQAVKENVEEFDMEASHRVH
jgi:hypothetical protein